MMDKRVLLIGTVKSFMVNAIMVGLEKEDFQVEFVLPDDKAIMAMEDKPKVYLLYLGDFRVDKAEFLNYLNVAIDSERFMLYLIGNQEELEFASSIIPKEKIQETYQRPLDVKLLAQNLNVVFDYSALDESQRKKVLIVDDDGAMLRMMKTWLSVKYHVYMATSGKIALSFLAQTPVDLVLLDYEMPVMNGPEVLKSIREMPDIKDTPVIFLTAKDDKESVMKVISLKPAKYLLKSMPKDKLISSIDDFFAVLENRQKYN